MTQKGQNWTKNGVILTLLLSVGSSLNYIYQQGQKRAVEKQQFIQDINQIKYDIDVLKVRCSDPGIDSIKSAIDELEINNHITPKF